MCVCGGGRGGGLLLSVNECMLAMGTWRSRTVNAIIRNISEEVHTCMCLLYVCVYCYSAFWNCSDPFIRLPVRGGGVHT